MVLFDRAYLESRQRWGTAIVTKLKATKTTIPEVDDWLSQLPRNIPGTDKQGWIYQLKGWCEVMTHSGISKESFDYLVSSFSTPRGPLKIVKYLWGFLTSETDSLAAPGHKYPFCEWTSKISSVYVNEEGGYSLSGSRKDIVN
jgi:hypothetical protein